MNRAKLEALANKLRGETLSETPSVTSADFAAYHRDAGYRAGWNDRTRACAAEVESLAKAEEG